MNDLPFWGVIALGLVVLIAARWAIPAAGGGLRLRPLSKAVLSFIDDRQRNGWLFLISFWAAVVAHPVIAVILYAFQSFFGFREFITRTPANAADYKALFASFFILLPLQYLFVGIGWHNLFTLLIPVYAFFLLPSLSAISGDTKDYFARAAKLQLGMMLCVYGLSHIPATLVLTETQGNQHAAYLMLFLVVVAQGGEITQYAVSRRFGKRRLARTVTRHLTVEGLGAGALASTILGLALYWSVPYNWPTNIGFSLAIFGAGVLGNLVLASIRKSTGIKDWGEAIQGRSSVLDRLGALCFAAPVYYHLARTIV
jgi:phosphatidate cytidylyltransferase